MSRTVATWLAGHRHGRRSVSRWRGRIGIGLLVLVLIALGGYYRLTDEDRLERYAEQWLERFSGGEASIESVRLDLFNGLHLVGVTIALPESDHFDSSDNSLAGRTIIHCATLFLRLRPFSLITGQLVVPEIVASDTELALVHDTARDIGNWEVMLAHRDWPEAQEAEPWRLPVIRLRNVRLSQDYLDAGGRTRGPRQIVYARARPDTLRPHVYRIDITRILDPDTPDMTGESGHLEIDTRSLAVTGSLPRLSIEELLFTASEEVRQWLDVLGLRGYVRPDTFTYERKAGGRATLTLGDARISIPVDAGERRLDPRDRYLRFEGVRGEIIFAGRTARVQLSGSFRDNSADRPVQVRGTLSLGDDASAGLAAVGFDLVLSAKGVPLPRGDDPADPAEVRFVLGLPLLAKFIREYDGTGPVDLEAKVTKAPGADQRIKFVEGTMTLRGVEGAYFKFPYRLDRVTGVVRFRPDGLLDIEDFEGMHGSTLVAITGVLGGYVTQRVELDIRMKNMPLDDDLIRCLKPVDQKLCRMFNAEALMDVRVRLNRPDVPLRVPREKFTIDVEARLIDGSVNLDPFPYPVRGVNGLLHIGGGRFEIHDMTARRGDARVRLEGGGTRAPDGSARFDVQIEATDVPLDDLLARALPDEGREMYEQFDPAGRAHIAGRIYTHEDTGRLGLDINASVADGAVTLPGTSVRLTDADARVRIDPPRLAIESLSGRFRDSNLALTATAGIPAGAAPTSVRLTSDHLLLDDALKDALPDSVQEAWNQFKPRGPVRMDLQFERAAAASQPADGSPSPAATRPALTSRPAATTRPATATTDYTAVIEPLGAAFTYEAFPLELTDVQGRVVATPARVELEDIRGRHGRAAVELTGHIDRDGDRRAGELALHARDITFDESVRQALPWRLKRLWNNVRPAGTIDLQLDRLTFAARPGSKTTWDFTGRVILRDAAFEIGPGFADLDGTLVAEGQMGDEMILRHGNLSLTRMGVANRTVTDVSATLERLPGDSVLRIRDIFGKFYEGTVIGWADINYVKGGPTFGLSLTIRDMSLGPFLNATRKPEQKPINMQGRVAGRLDLAGKLGDSRTRRGGGNLVIRQAQMFKVPLVFAILQVIHFAIDDDNAFHDATFRFMVDGSELILQEIDLRGKALSMVGAGRVHTPTRRLDLTLLVGSPLRLPRIEVLTELLEGVARELMEVHVEGTLEQPTFRADIVRSVGRTLDALLNARRPEARDTP